GRDEGRAGRQRGDELRSAGTIAVGVVEELAGRRVVDDAVVGVVAAGRARSGVEAHVVRRELAGCADLREGRGVQLDAVPARVGVRRTELVPDVLVLSRAAGDGVVAGAALDAIVAGVGEDRVVAAEAFDQVGTVRAVERIGGVIARRAR